MQKAGPEAGVTPCRFGAGRAVRCSAFLGSVNEARPEVAKTEVGSDPTSGRYR